MTRPEDFTLSQKSHHTRQRTRTPVLLLAQELNFGGSERQLCEMVRGLDPNRFAAHAGCFRPDGIRAREIVADGIPLAQFSFSSFHSPSNVWSSVLALRRYVRTHGIRVVHAFDAPTNLFVAVAACFLGRAVVLTSRRSSRQLRPPATRTCLSLANRITDGVVVNCEAVREELVSVERVPIRRIHLCYNGLDSGRFRRVGTAPPDIIPPHALVIGAVCVLRREKGLSTLLSAFAACYASNPDLFLVIVGDGPERADLEKRAHELGITSRCLFQPAAVDVVPWLSLIDIFVSPSVFEALSNALMEAMACGCACIASRVGGNPELVHDEETGLLFAKDDVQGLVEQLRRLIADPSLRQRLGERAAAMIGSRFSLRIAAARLGAIYEEAIAAQGTVR